jgi:hypothetical protein
MHKVLDKPYNSWEAIKTPLASPTSRPIDHYYRYSHQIIPGRERNFRLYAQKPVVPRDRHSLTDIKDPFGGRFGRKLTKGRQAVEPEWQWWVVFKLTYVHQIAGVGVAVWFG